MDEITAVKSVGVAGGEPLALVAIFLLLCYAVAWSVDLYLPLVESGEREACGSVAALRCGVAVAHAAKNLSCVLPAQPPKTSWRHVVPTYYVCR